MATMDRQRRLNININQFTSRELEETARKRDITITEAARRLIGAGKYVLDAQDRGGTLIVRHRNGDKEEVRFLF